MGASPSFDGSAPGADEDARTCCTARGKPSAPKADKAMEAGSRGRSNGAHHCVPAQAVAEPKPDNIAAADLAAGAGAVVAPPAQQAIRPWAPNAAAQEFVPGAFAAAANGACRAPAAAGASAPAAAKAFNANAPEFVPTSKSAGNSFTATVADDSPSCEVLAACGAWAALAAKRKTEAEPLAAAAGSTAAAPMPRAALLRYRWAVKAPGSGGRPPKALQSLRLSRA
mmetsp:Transcript_102164/g.286345  ORF Transcript_102164/g.286345 Transcript_102164/m.286345 type:complete len:226 (-) Transcript_102164:255-932(-)